VTARLALWPRALKKTAPKIAHPTMPVHQVWMLFRPARKIAAATKTFAAISPARIQFLIRRSAVRNPLRGTKTVREKRLDLAGFLRGMAIAAGERIRRL
jgi:hypothetical protein